MEKESLVKALEISNHSPFQVFAHLKPSNALMINLIRHRVNLDIKPLVLASFLRLMSGEQTPDMAIIKPVKISNYSKIEMYGFKVFHKSSKAIFDK